MESRHRLPDAHWANLLGRAAGVYPPFRHPRLLDAGRRDQQPPPGRRHREHRFGPFHVDAAPIRETGGTISLDGKGESCLFEGRVIDLHGEPIEGATVDVWSDNADGFYDVQQPGIQPKWNNRGRFVTGVDGKYTSSASIPSATRFPTTDRLDKCSATSAATPTVRRTCTTSSPRRASKGRDPHVRWR